MDFLELGFGLVLVLVKWMKEEWIEGFLDLRFWVSG